MQIKWKEKILEEAKHVNNPFDAYASNPFIMPEGRPVSEMDIQEAEIVVYVISRISGEGKDRRLEKGDYYLSEREEKDILFLNSRCVPIVLLINAGGPVELTDILEKAQWIKGILNISQLGQEGGRAVARILLGEAVPSGKLTTTWAKKYADVPFAENFSYLNGNLELEEYKEGIYVGYRYFDSFGVEPLFPFGFGLSYTDFNDKKIDTTSDVSPKLKLTEPPVTLPKAGAKVMTILFASLSVLAIYYLVRFNITKNNMK